MGCSDLSLIGQAWGMCPELKPESRYTTWETPQTESGASSPKKVEGCYQKTMDGPSEGKVLS